MPSVTHNHVEYSILLSLIEKIAVEISRPFGLQSFPLRDNRILFRITLAAPFLHLRPEKDIGYVAVVDSNRRLRGIERTYETVDSSF